MQDGHEETLKVDSTKAHTRFYSAMRILRAYLSRESVSQTKVCSCGNPTAARRATAGLGNIPNTAEPLPASEASVAPFWSKARLIRSSRGWRRATGPSKSFERPLPCALQDRAQNCKSLGFAAGFVKPRGPAFTQRKASGVGTRISCGTTTRTGSFGMSWRG